MEMLVVALIAMGAFAAVLVPLFRRRPGVGDEREFEAAPPATTAMAATMAPGGAPESDSVEAEVLRYREAVRAGTICRKCGQASPPGSAFCFECGARLPLADAKEFE